MIERISYLVAIALAVGAPFLTAMVTNRHQRKLKELELSNQKAMLLYDQFVSAYESFVENSEAMHAHTPPTIAFEKSVSSLYRFFPQEDWGFLDLCLKDPHDNESRANVKNEGAILLQELYQDIPSKYQKQEKQ